MICDSAPSTLMRSGLLTSIQQAKTTLGCGWNNELIANEIFFIKYLCKIWSWLRIFYLVWIFSSSFLEKKPSLNWPPSDQQDPVCQLPLRLDSLWQWCGKTLILTCICLNSDLRSDSLQLQLLCPSCPPSPLFIDLFQTNRLFCSWPQWIKHLMTWVRVGYKIW